jgi:hypothetical protein
MPTVSYMQSAPMSFQATRWLRVKCESLVCRVVWYGLLPLKKLKQSSQASRQSAVAMTAVLGLGAVSRGFVVARGGQEGGSRGEEERALSVQL